MRFHLPSKRQTGQRGYAPLLGTLVALTFGCIPQRLSAAGMAYYELRIYDVTTNKIEAVLERFRDTVDPVRRNIGIECAGYWTAATPAGDKFIYLLSAPSDARLRKQEQDFGADPEFRKGYAASNQKHGRTVDKIRTIPLVAEPFGKFEFATNKIPRAFDLRLYSVLPGKLEAFRARWRDHAVPIYERHGLHSVGWWVAEKKDAEGNEQFVCLLAGESLTSIQDSIIAFHKDEEWQRVEGETERDGKLRGQVEAFKMRPTDFSVLR